MSLRGAGGRMFRFVSKCLPKAFCFFIFKKIFGTGNQAQDFVSARQVLMLLSCIPGPSCSFRLGFSRALFREG